ncbi:MAG: GNAT family N-acyltransferase [Pseudomonadota bacterium]|nr:GNAT family N-acyltransferase [Pseudomonadota bacterium]
MSTELLMPAQHYTTHKFEVRLATELKEIRQAQALRYQIFSEEMGAQMNTPIPAYDIDRFDPYCHHLLVREKQKGQIVGYSRILTSEQAQIAGGFYSESEFDLTHIFKLPGRFIEVGRSCVHADYRNGVIMGLLWSGLARFMVAHQFDYLMGCASIPMSYNHHNILFTRLQERYSTPIHLRVTPKVPLLKDFYHTEPVLSLPSLFKAYLRLGAQICGDPCWDPTFKVADVFILVTIANLQQRYVKHFVNRVHTLDEVAA